MAALLPRIISAEETALFLRKCSRVKDRCFFPCNAKHRAPLSCTFLLRTTSTAVGHRCEESSIAVCVDECEYLAGGTGWRVWPCALMLSCWLALHQEAIQLQQATVLELGCGLGLPGLTAAALGARAVVLSDCLPKLLCTVRQSVERYLEKMDSDRRSSAGLHVCCADGTGEAGGAAEGPELATGNGRDGEVPCAAGRRGHQCKESRSACDADDGGYERCESCESCESCGYSKRCERFGGGAGGVEEGKEDGSSEGRGGLHQRLRVSFLDWDLEASSVVVDVEETFSTEQGVKTQQQAEASAASLALSSLEPAEKFDLILASDVIYSSCHARRLPAVVGKRMSAGGRMAAMVPVRSESNSREFFDGLVAAGMHVRYALVDTDWVDHIVSLQSGASAASSRNKAVKAAPSERNKQQQRKLNAAPMLAYSHQAPLTEGSILFVHAEWAVNEARQQAKSDEFGR